MGHLRPIVPSAAPQGSRTCTGVGEGWGGGGGQVCFGSPLSDKRPNLEEKRRKEEEEEEQEQEEDKVIAWGLAPGVTG